MHEEAAHAGIAELLLASMIASFALARASACNWLSRYVRGAFSRLTGKGGYDPGRIELDESFAIMPINGMLS